MSKMIPGLSGAAAELPACIVLPPLAPSGNFGFLGSPELGTPSVSLPRRALADSSGPSQQKRRLPALPLPASLAVYRPRRRNGVAGQHRRALARHTNPAGHAVRTPARSIAHREPLNL